MYEAHAGARVSRRWLLVSLAATGTLAATVGGRIGTARSDAITARPIPSSGEQLPVIGLGSWITFNVGYDKAARDSCAEVMRNFFDAGGRLIDSSPMYGSSQAVIGYGLNKLGKPPTLFSADKVWISSGARGPGQIESSRRHWDVPRFDLLQVHNLVGWREHLPTLLAMKARTAALCRHHDLGRAAASRGGRDHAQPAVGFRAGDLQCPGSRGRGAHSATGARAGHCGHHQPTLPARRADRQRRAAPPAALGGRDGCANWAQFLLKFIIAHPAVTCAIPATTSIAHVLENMGAAHGALPDESMRRRMTAHVEQL